MSAPQLRVGEPAFQDGPPLPIDGARLCMNGPLIRLLIGYHEPTPSEMEAVRSGAVELGVFHDGGVAAVAVRVGEEGGRWRIEARASLILLDVPAHIDGVGGDGAPTTSPDAYPAELALCDPGEAVVVALRHLMLPEPIVTAARRAAHAQAARFETPGAAIRTHERALRTRTVRHLMEHATARVRINPRQSERATSGA